MMILVSVGSKFVNGGFSHEWMAPFTRKEPATHAGSSIAPTLKEDGQCYCFTVFYT